MNFKREKITNIKEIEKLYKDGKISRTTYWRAKKRGYIWINFHSPQKLSDYVLSKQEQYDFYNYCAATARNFISEHQKWFLDQQTFNTLAQDIAADLFLYVIERQPINLKQAKARIKSAKLALSQNPRWYGKYLDFPIRKKSGQEKNNLSLDSFTVDYELDDFSTAFASSLL